MSMLVEGAGYRGYSRIIVTNFMGGYGTSQGFRFSQQPVMGNTFLARLLRNKAEERYVTNKRRQ